VREAIAQACGEEGKNVFMFDRDSIRSHAEARRVAGAFYRTPGAILLGTAMALPYLAGPIEHAAIVSADSLLSIPEWRAHERLAELLFSIHSIASKSFLIQTRRPDEKLLSYAAAGDVADFYLDELESRRQFAYPPYATLIKIAVSGKREPVAALMKELVGRFERYKLHAYAPALQPRPSSFTLYGLIKVPREQWPDMELVALLRQLPPHVAIEVDPESLL
jgi:primosomal protein N' (replication factor Y)